MAANPERLRTSDAPGFRSGRTWFIGRHAVAQLLLWSGLYYLFPAVSARILADTDWTAQFLTASFTAGFLLWALLSPIVGRAIDRGYGARVMRGGAVLGALLLVAMSQAQSVTVFAAFMVLLGVPMAATLYDPCFALILRRSGSSGGSAVATVTLIAGFATLVTFPMVSWLVDFSGWRAVLLAAAAMVLISAPMIPAEGPTVAMDPAPEQGSMGRASPAVLVIGVAFAALLFTHAAVLFTLPVHLRQVPATADVALILPALLGPAQIVGRLICAPLVRRMDPVLAVRGLFALMLVPLLALLVLPYRIETILPVLLLQGAGYGMQTILRPILARGYVPTFRLGRDLGLIAMIGLVMMALGPAAGGAVWQWSGFRMLAGLLLVLNIAGFILLMWLPRQGAAHEA